MQFYVPSKGKKILRILPGKIIYLTESKQEQNQPSSFCIFLRKYLANARVREIKQIGFERIISFLLETKDAKYQLIIELFDKGNIILADDKNKIINCLEQQRWKEREIKKDVIYRYSQKKYDFLELKLKDLKDIFKNSKSNLVKTLATELGLGGVYSEEVCSLAELDKEKTANRLTDEEIKTLFDNLSSLKNKKIDSYIAYVGREISNILPFSLKSHDEKIKKIKTFNSALELYFTEEAISPEEIAKKKAIEKQKKVIEKQEQRIQELKKEVEENKKKAEIIYENYALIEGILNEINKAKKKYSWQEIKDKLEGHKTIKEVNAKDKKIIIEI